MKGKKEKDNATASGCSVWSKLVLQAVVVDFEILLDAIAPTTLPCTVPGDVVVEIDVAAPLELVRDLQAYAPSDQTTGPVPLLVGR